jgi:hypothetical protein
MPDTTLCLLHKQDRSPSLAPVLSIVSVPRYDQSTLQLASEMQVSSPATYVFDPYWF